MQKIYTGGFLWMLLFCFHASGERSYTETSVIKLNGTNTTVFFSDSDTFRILDGEHKGAPVRGVGYNGLETYGRVHEWEENSADYLLDVANEATKVTRAGSWSCSLEAERDAYGRFLAHCNDLALALITDGLAHAYSADEEPAKRIFLTAQKKAQTEALGIWKYGVPEYIVTSLHATSEGPKKTYNRLISAKDGHSERWYHNNDYDVCERVCYQKTNSCMTYVPYDQRYGKNRASCLKKKTS